MSRDVENGALARHTEAEGSGGFTPGPWVRNRDGSLYGASGKQVVLGRSAFALRLASSTPEEEANTALCEAAPDMHVVLSIVFPFLTGIIEEQPHNEAVAMLRNSVRNVLAKATQP